MARKYSRSASKSVKRAMRKRKSGTLKSGGSGKKVISRKQAIAIGLSEARRAGKKVPRKSAKKSSTKKSAAKKAATRKTPRKKASTRKTSGRKTARKTSGRKASRR